MNKETLSSLLEEILNSESLILAVLSSPLEKAQPKKVTIRPVVIKGSILYQMTEQSLAQALHDNLNAKRCLDWLKMHLKTYKQAFFYTKTADYQLLTNKKEKMTLLVKPPSKLAMTLVHNRPKHYLLLEGIAVPFMVDLGLMTAQGKIVPQKSDKFRQINRFLEMIEDVLSHLESDKTIHIIDFGCGKAYLTFALYHYLKFVKKLKVDIRGLDLKPDVIAYCQNLVVKLGYADDLHFQLGDISSYQTDQSVDMVISLHACDTATDAALEKAVKWQSKIILCVPCCQHELYSQVQNSMLTPLLKHGILKERFAALSTDALRAQLLEVLGYQTQVLEFIDMEHTPKNLLIRAIRNIRSEAMNHKWQTYLEMKTALHADPALERFLKNELIYILETKQ